MTERQKRKAEERAKRRQQKADASHARRHWNKFPGSAVLCERCARAKAGAA